MLNTATKSLIATSILAGFNSAAIAVSFEVEGKLTAVSMAEVTCNGVNIKLVDATLAVPETRPQTVISTPTNGITVDQLLSPTLLPGQTRGDTDPYLGKSAFLGGTCIIIGESEGPPEAPILYARTFFTEVAEHVMVGPVTSTKTDQFAIAGVKIKMLGKYKDGNPLNDGAEDPNLDGNGQPAPRIEALPPQNEFGYEVDLSTVPQGDLSAAEGHLFGDTFYAFAVETTGGDRLGVDPNVGRAPSATIQIANARNRNNIVELEVRGGCDFGKPADGQPLPASVPILIAVDQGLTAPNTPKWVVPGDSSTYPAGIPQGYLNANRAVQCTAEAPGSQNGVYRYRFNYNRGTAPAPTMVMARVQVTPWTSTPEKPDGDFSQRSTLSTR